jgi:hypothetical protein
LRRCSCITTLLQNLLLRGCIHYLRLDRILVIHRIFHTLFYQIDQVPGLLAQGV